MGGWAAPPSTLHEMSPRSVEMAPSRADSLVLLGAQMQITANQFQGEILAFEERQRQFEVQQAENEEKMLKKMDEVVNESARKVEIGNALLQNNVQEFCTQLMETMVGEGAKDGSQTAILVNAAMRVCSQEIEKKVEAQFLEVKIENHAQIEKVASCF